MRQLLFFLIIALCAKAYCQVPKQDRIQGSDEMGVDEPIPMIDAPMKKTAADEVRGISQQANGKMSFVMGDDTKKGLYDRIDFVHNNISYIVKEGNLYGIANKKAEIIVKIKYDSIAADNYNNIGFIVKLKGKYGIISNSGKIIHPIDYNKILARNQDITLVKNEKNETELVFNKQIKSLNKNIEYAEVYQNLTIIKSDGKFGVVKNELIVPLEYDSIFVPIKDPQHRTIGSFDKPIKKGNTPNPLIKPYQSISCLTLQKNNQVGLLNGDGKIIYPAENDEVYEAEMFGYYRIKKGNLFGIYFSKSKDKKHTEIEFDRISVDGYGAIMASKNKKMGIFNLEGEQIAPFEYDNDFIAQFSGIGFRISKDKKRGIIDKQGNVIVPPIYDDVSTFSLDIRDVFLVKNGEKYGIVNNAGKVILPIDFEYIRDLNKNFLVVTPQRKVGLYDKHGNVIVPVKYQWISETSTQYSHILVLKEDDNSYNFLDENYKIILPENVSDYAYVMDEEKLISPIGRKGMLHVKTKNGKSGLLNEISGKLDVPLVYDEIIQYTSSSDGHSYFSVKKDNKYGLINEKNEVILPIHYDDINLTFATSTASYDENEGNENQKNEFQVVVAKDKKYGTVNLKDEVVIPFQYLFLQRLSNSGLFKAKTGKYFQIIDKNGKVISNSTFDEVANFELVEENNGENYILQALTFSNGKMRVIDSKGHFVTKEIPMQPHLGYETFDELKFALIRALESKDEIVLKEFVNRIAPSEHILYYLKQNLFDNSSLNVNIETIKDRYLYDLLEFKQNEWNVDTSYGYPGYNRSSLDVDDYTLYSERYSIVTNTRTTDHAFGDSRFMEKLLRNAVKVNGYWISTYFMTRGFDRD